MAARTDHRSNIRHLLTIAVVGFSLAWLSAWLTGLIVDPGTWPIRYTLFGLGFIALGTLTTGWVWALAKEQAVATAFFEALSRLTPNDAENGAASLPKLDASNPQCDVATRFRQTYVEQCTRLQQAEHARAALDVRMRRNAARYEQVDAILANLTEPVLVVDGYDELLLANASAEKLLGLNHGKLETRALSQLVRCEKLLDLLSDVRRRKTPAQRSAEVELTDASGEPRWFDVSARHLALGNDAAHDRTAGKACAVAVLRDIGHVKAIQKRNAEFVSAVSHEMKTPLAGIKAYVELLADGDAEDEHAREEFLSVINSQANRLQRLIDNLLNLARIEAGVVQVSKGNCSLNELLEEAAQIVQPAADSKKMQFTTELSPLYLSVHVDRDMLMQVAINLLSNAIKYTPEGGTVVLRSRMAGDQVQFDVKDNGVGLSSEDCLKVFEKFYRVKKDRDMAPGTGLGLALAKHIVEDVHGGALSVMSQLGAGSTFLVTLPCAGQVTGGE